MFSKNAFKWLLLSFLLVWLVGIALFASSNSTASDIQGKNFNYAYIEDRIKKFNLKAIVTSISTIHEHF